MLVMNASQLGRLVRDARRQKGWSQEHLADAVGASRNWVQSVEGGKANVSLDKVLQLLQWVDLAVDVRPVPPDEYVDEMVGIDRG
ncbi:hypothetical protein GCM10027059_03110 [Myceligenerans halotolerans]